MSAATSASTIAKNEAIAEAQEQNLAEVVDRYAPLVKRIAHHLLLRMPASVQIDDLIQSGMIGLLEAAKKYDVSKGASFETYAGIRIRGSMLDEVRKGDWAPRSVHRKSRKVAEAIKAIEARTGQDAKDVQVAKEMNIDLNATTRFCRMLLGAGCSVLTTSWKAMTLQLRWRPVSCLVPATGCSGIRSRRTCHGLLMACLSVKNWSSLFIMTRS